MCTNGLSENLAKLTNSLMRQGCTDFEFFFALKYIVYNEKKISQPCKNVVKWPVESRHYCRTELWTRNAKRKIAAIATNGMKKRQYSSRCSDWVYHATCNAWLYSTMAMQCLPNIGTRTMTFSHTYQERICIGSGDNLTSSTPWLRSRKHWWFRSDRVHAVHYNVKLYQLRTLGNERSPVTVVGQGVFTTSSTLENSIQGRRLHKASLETTPMACNVHKLWLRKTHL